MTETIAPPPIEHAPQLDVRQSWSDQKAIEHSVLDAYGYGDAYHLPAETLKAEGSFAVTTLRRLIEHRRTALGPAEDILTSHHAWNKIAYGGMDDGTVRKLLGDTTIQTYLDRRAEHIHTMNDDLVERYPEMADAFIKGVREGRELGFIPDEVTDERIEDSVATVGVTVTDSSLLDEGHEDGAYGTYDQEDDTVRVSSDINCEKRFSTVIHELRHRLSGGTFRKTIVKHYTSDTLNQDGQLEYKLTPVYFRTRTGFQERDRHRALDEALVEHTTLSIMNGDWETLDPDEREDDGVYHVERFALSELIKRSNGILDLKTMMRASFEDTTPHGNTLERRRMMRQFRHAFGAGAAHKFDRLVDQLEKELDKDHSNEHIDKFLADHIHSPEVDEHGNITKSGWIDVDFEREAA